MRALWLAAILLTAGTALWACAPFFPTWLLGSSDLLTAPSRPFYQSLPEIAPSGPPPFPAVPAQGDPYDLTSKIDAEDVRQAVEKSGALPAVREKILKAHADLRAALGGKEAAPDLAVPRGLPPELADYLEGAIAYHQHRLDAARAAWERLLTRPAAERALRSTWAAFMLGKASMAGDPDAAVRWFERTRELAAQGFADPLGLAFDSLGWQARTEMDRKRYDRALPLYLVQSRGDDAGAASSLRLACSEALAGGRDALVRAARAPRSRAILTAWVLTPGDEPHARDWLRALKAAGVRRSEGADRLAWAAYEAGDFAAAREWAARASGSAPMARWIRAKLLLRDGKLAAAGKLLHAVAGALPPTDMNEQDASGYAWTNHYSVQLATGPEAAGEEAVVLLSQGRFREALDGFLHNGFWLDAAWVAERVMTADELKSVVDAAWPADLAARYKPSQEDGLYAGGFIRYRPERLAYDLRYLLARRLIRAGRYREARDYLPAELKPALDTLASGIQNGGEADRPARDRARALFGAACTARKQGMELLGTELDPDWFALDRGEYELTDYVHGIASRGRNHLPPPAPEERERAAKHRANPAKRFHYRYRAADLARQAAKLLPDGTEEKARILASAGSWLAGKDPTAALPFYRELIRCCRATPLGREAAERRWFPEAPACDAP